MKLFNGDCLEQMKAMDAHSIHAIVTDPPYGLSFMNKKWDYEVPSIEIWRQVLRILKPGGHVLSFGGPRTYHRMVVNIEDAGFEIRDQIQWLYGSGFPKSHNIKQGDFKGWGTALKPANEPIVLARKPLEGTVAKNIEKWGCGGLNIDASRIGTEERFNQPRGTAGPTNSMNSLGYGPGSTVQGRWPANIILDETAAEMLDKQSGVLKSGSLNSNHVIKARVNIAKGIEAERHREKTFGGDSGGASRFFFVVKNDKDDSWQDQNDSVFVKHVANSFKCDAIRLASVLEAVRINFKHDRHLLQCLDSIPDFKKCILLHSLASLAVKPENIGITEITQSLLKLFGSAHHVIDENTNLANQKNNSAPTRFIYQAKASKRERNAGLEGMPEKYNDFQRESSGLSQGKDPISGERSGKRLSPKANYHPTVKPIKLMEYLCRLITPPNGVILDPFMGSGSTGMAAKNLGFNFIGIELDASYFEIAQKRLA